MQGPARLNVRVGFLIRVQMTRRAQMQVAVSAILFATVLVSACVPYPIYKTLQPSAQVTVLNQAGQPLSGAEATLISNAYPYGWEKGRLTQATRTDGKAVFDSAREWRAEVLMIHGAEVFFWNWCIRKDGYVTHATASGSSGEFQDDLVVRLEPGASTPCPKSFR